ncbi:MAG TPA: hypothetical protein PK340_05535 [Bacilli bacterium]|nr:hypothetical protein [Bacilli bacterium]
MEKIKFSYGWLLKWILAAILLAVGITMVVVDSIVFFVTGLFLLIFSIFRVVPLLKTLKKEALRLINLVEIVVDIIIGGLLLYVGIRDMVDASWTIPPVWSYIYGFSIGLVLLGRGIIFFYSTTFLGEKSEQIKFWSHVVVMTLGSAITVLTIQNNFSNKVVAVFILILCFIGGAYLTYDGFNGYQKYRKSQKELNVTPKPRPKKKDTTIKEVPEKPEKPKPEKEQPTQPIPQPEPEKEEEPTIVN